MEDTKKNPGLNKDNKELSLNELQELVAPGFLEANPNGGLTDAVLGQLLGPRVDN
ncbi:hypothetical protein ACQKGI_20910 [Peribacillus muralis]|uniref:hypothetical protein n=1 Tax=Peribacillus muralis TaxID=264697 RepID=UPI000A7F4E63|nr:hypothetical protein [Peribacillus muralis]